MVVEAGAVGGGLIDGGASSHWLDSPISSLAKFKWGVCWGEDAGVCGRVAFVCLGLRQRFLGWLSWKQETKEI